MKINDVKTCLQQDANNMAEKEAKASGKSALFSGNLSKRQLIELDACVNCGECLKWCPIQDATEEPAYSPPAKIREMKRLLEEERGLKALLLGRGEIDEERLKRFREILWKCALCGNCGAVCEVGIDTKKLWWTLRKSVCESRIGPFDPLKGASANFEKNRSPFPKPLANRYKIWRPDDIEIAERAEVGFYEGCGGAWDAPQSAEAAARLLAAGGPFTMLDPGEAWCCGWPMVTGTGDWSAMPELVNKLVTAVKDKGIKRLAMICPMCRDIITYLFPEFYGDELPFECLMVSEVLAEYVEDGRIKFTKSREETVTNHDPCSLARPHVGAPVIEPPRKILRALPGVSLVEMQRHGEMTRCCGGAAGQRPLNPELTVKMAKELVFEAERTGADTMVTSCPACYVTIVAVTHFAPNPAVDEYKKFEKPVKVNDLLQYAAAFL